MSNLIINIRIGLYHFQLGFSPFKIEVGRNYFHKGYPNGFFAIYEFFGWTLTKYGFKKSVKN